MSNNRYRLLSKIYTRDYNNMVTGKKSIYYGIRDWYPLLFDFRHYPRKKKKKLKTAHDKWMSE